MAGDIIIIVFFYETLEDAMNYFLFSQPFRNGTRIVLLLAILLMSFGYGGTGVAYAAPPIHDNFDAAIVINAIEFHDTVNTTEATPSDTVPNVDDPVNIPCEGDTLEPGFASVWYKYTPPESQSLSLDTIGSNYDTFIAVWTGSRGSLSPVACNDLTSGGHAELSFVASAGTVYYIEIAQYNDGQGTTSNIGGTLKFNAYITNTNVIIGGALKGRYFIPDSGGLRRSFINLNNGPVEIFNVAGNQIIAAERVIYRVNNVYTSFSEMMGLPHSQLSTTYWLPWYNNVAHPPADGVHPVEVAGEEHLEGTPVAGVGRRRQRLVARLAAATRPAAHMGVVLHARHAASMAISETSVL